jgi:hypothetical protein
MKNPYEILDEIKRVYPNELPPLKDYSPDAVLVAIGRQEVIRLFQSLLERSD